MRKVTAHRPAHLQIAAYLSIDKQSSHCLDFLTCPAARWTYLRKIEWLSGSGAPGQVTGLQQGNCPSTAKPSVSTPACTSFSVAYCQKGRLRSSAIAHKYWRCPPCSLLQLSFDSHYFLPVCILTVLTFRASQTKLFLCGANLARLACARV